MLQFVPELYLYPFVKKIQIPQSTISTVNELSYSCSVHYPAAISCLHNLDAGCRLGATSMDAMELEVTTVCDNQQGELTHVTTPRTQAEITVRIEFSLAMKSLNMSSVMNSDDRKCDNDLTVTKTVTLTKTVFR